MQQLVVSTVAIGVCLQLSCHAVLLCIVVTLGGAPPRTPFQQSSVAVVPQSAGRLVLLRAICNHSRICR